jgi:hypothetical protein
MGIEDHLLQRVATTKTRAITGKGESFVTSFGVARLRKTKRYRTATHR